MAQYGSGVVVTGQLDSLGSDELSVYLFAGEAHSLWVGGFDTAGAGYLTDPRLTIAGDPADPNTSGIGPVVAEDNAEGRNPVLSFTATVEGWYLVTVTDAGVGGGRYDLIDNNRAFESDIVDHTGLGTPGTDVVLAMNDTLTSDIGRVADSDLVAVTLNAGESYSITCRGLPGGTAPLATPTIAVLDSNGVLLQQDSGDTVAFISFTPSSTGTYFVQATGGGATGQYALQVYDGNLGFDYVPGTTATSFSAPLGGSIFGSINDTGDQDYYAINLAQSFSYRFDLSSNGLVNPFLELRDGTGALVASNDDGGPGNNAELTYIVPNGASGTYYLVARDAGSGSGAFRLETTMLDQPPLSTIIVGADAAATHPVTIIGSDAPDELYGTNLGDTISGGLGGDYINGAGGADLLTGGPGDDNFDNLDPTDTVSAGDGFDRMNTTFSWTLASDQEFLNLYGANNVSGTGNSGSNLIYGNDGANTLSGAAGNDVIDGYFGNDRIDGGTGYDTAAYYFEGAVNVSLAIAGAQNTGSAGFDTLIGIENLDGGAFADRLTGNAGGNVLYGGGGNDTLTGGGGRDLLTGAGGLDRMKLNALSDSGTTFAQRDVLNTFAHGDKVDLTAIDANSRVAGNQAFTFVTNFTHVAGQLQWDKTAPTGYLVSGDVNGDGVADFSLQIYAAPGFGTIHSWDFIL
jgi:Ca2+-binding RTX toxin-like protein